MDRTIKFRGKRCSDDKWVYGFYVESKYSWKGHKPHKSWIVPNAISNGGFFNILGRYAVKDDTVGQFTGLYDKNHNEIYEGDIVEFYETKSYCINPDCEPHIRGYGTCIYKRVCEVKFVDGVFGVESRNEFVDLEVLAWCGLHTEELEDMKEMEESDAYFDTNGFDINDSIVGIKVIGNIHDNFDLMK